MRFRRLGCGLTPILPAPVASFPPSWLAEGVQRPANIVAERQNRAARLTCATRRLVRLQRGEGDSSSRPAAANPSDRKRQRRCAATTSRA